VDGEYSCVSFDYFTDRFCSAIFQAGSLLVLIAESRTRSYLASIVPVIVNTVLNEHQLVLDIVAFVSKGDFPRSRLGEKQRGKILASWVSRKMQTIAQFSIRDPDAEGSVGTAVPEEMGRRTSAQSGLGNTQARHSQGSLKRAPGTAGSSLRHVESVSQMPSPAPTLPLHIEPRDYDNDFDPHDHAYREHNDETPTNERPRPLTLDTSVEFNIVDSYDHSPTGHEEDISPDAQRGMGMHLDPYAQNYSHVQGQHNIQNVSHGPQVPSTSPLRYEDYNAHQSGSYTGYSGGGVGQIKEEYSPVSPLNVPGLGGLRVANAGDNDGDSEDDWGESALKQLNLGGRAR